MKWLRTLGPGIAVAATGVGAGDMVAASVAGSQFGLAVAWAVVFGAVLKFVLNEGLARWQLVTGKSLIAGWAEHLGPWVSRYFLIYLVLWSFMVGAALISACGLAAHTVFPSLKVSTWGLIHTLLGIAFVLSGHYQLFENVMKSFIALMFLTLIGCALWVAPPLETAVGILTSIDVPPGSSRLMLGVLGGVGGTLTLLSYGYWIREKGWTGKKYLRTARLDLAVGYVLTGLFGLAVAVLAAKVLHPAGVKVAGSQGVVQMAAMLEQSLGRQGFWLFAVGFWAATATSLLGVWQSVPGIFVEAMAKNQKHPWARRRYIYFLLYLGVAPLSLLFYEKPIAVIVLYSVVGSLFMPFLAVTLLIMNSRVRWVGTGVSGWACNTFLLISIGLYAYLGILGILRGLKLLAL